MRWMSPPLLPPRGRSGWWTRRGGARGWRFRFGPSRGDASAAPEAPVRAQHHSWWFRARIPRQGPTTFRGKGKRFRPDDSATRFNPIFTRQPRNTPRNRIVESCHQLNPTRQNTYRRQRERREGKKEVTRISSLVFLERWSSSGERSIRRTSVPRVSRSSRGCEERWENRRRSDTDPQRGA